jgi:ribosomal-protein-serine acetyltransferase
MLHIPVEDGFDLRLLEERHAEELFRLSDRNREYLRKWLPWVDRTHSPSDSLLHIRMMMSSFENREALAAGIFLNGELAGSIGVHRIDWLNRNTSIGYWLAEGFQGRGIMTRACRAIVDHAFREYNLHRIEIRCATGNGKSCAIPERLGFVRDGVLRESQLLGSSFADLVVYGMLDRDWNKA